MVIARLLCLLVMLVPGVALGQSADGDDYAGFNRFPGSTLTEYRQEEQTVYTLPLGRMQRVDGVVAPDRSERVTGRLYRLTYEIPAGFSAADAFQHFSEQLLRGGQLALFECRGRRCGSSNYWANDVFDNRVLYGPVEGQFYLAATYRSRHEGQPVNGYAALYTVTRGNRRVYAHLDFLELPEGASSELLITPDAIRRQLEDTGAAVIPRLSFADNDGLEESEGVGLIVDILQSDSLLEVFVVAHLREADEDLDTLVTRSSRRAESIRERLVESGITASRVIARGVGPLAPRCPAQDCNERIELVIRP